MEKRLAKITLPCDSRIEKSAGNSEDHFLQVVGEHQEICGPLKMGTKSGVLC